MMRYWWIHVRSWFMHHLTMYRIRSGKLQYGRQLVKVGKDGGVVTGGQQHNVQVRHRIIVKARVFRAATGKYEELGEIVNKEV